MILRALTLMAVTMILSAQVALAGPFADYEAALRQAYASYRTALFQTNVANAPQSAQALAQFKERWSALSRQPVPPQYADDPAYVETMGKVSAIAETAAAEITSGKLSESHETLESIRDIIGSLRARNGIYGFSDRMNAYHERMEEMLTVDLSGPDAIGHIREEAAVLAYLVAELESHPPTDADKNEFPALLRDVKASVVRLQDAARKTDAVALKSAISALKQPYAKLFLKFG